MHIWVDQPHISYTLVVIFIYLVIVKPVWSLSWFLEFGYDILLSFVFIILLQQCLARESQLKLS